MARRINWLKIIDEAEARYKRTNGKRGFSPYAKQMSGGWSKCAVGAHKVEEFRTILFKPELLFGINRYSSELPSSEQSPEDEMLYKHGSKFYTDVWKNDFNAARRTYNTIHRRVQSLVNTSLKEKKEECKKLDKVSTLLTSLGKK